MNFSSLGNASCPTVARRFYRRELDVVVRGGACCGIVVSLLDVRGAALGPRKCIGDLLLLVLHVVKI